MFVPNRNDETVEEDATELKFPKGFFNKHLFFFIKFIQIFEFLNKTFIIAN